MDRDQLNTILDGITFTLWVITVLVIFGLFSGTDHLLTRNAIRMEEVS